MAEDTQATPRAVGILECARLGQRGGHRACRVAITSQTDASSQRLQLALAYMNEPTHAIALIPPRPTEAEAETQRLTAQVRALAAEREQLSARVANLERNPDDVTGSITRQASLAVLLRPANPPPAPLAPANMPSVTATVPASVSESASALPPPRKAEFGIDLGGASSVETLRIHWATMRSNYGALLGGLHAVIAQRPWRPAGTEYRLLGGAVADRRRGGTFMRTLPGRPRRLPPGPVQRYQSG